VRSTAAGEEASGPTGLPGRRLEGAFGSGTQQPTQVAPPALAETHRRDRVSTPRAGSATTTEFLRSGKADEVDQAPIGIDSGRWNGNADWAGHRGHIDGQAGEAENLGGLTVPAGIGEDE